MWSIKHKCGGQEGIVHAELELAQMRVGKRLLGASNSVAGVAVQGDLRWGKLEEGREEIKVLFGKSFEGIEVSRLDEDSGGETKRGWRNGVVGRV